MPAVTADTLALPRLTPAALGDTERPVRSVTTGPRGYEGEGFPVVRAFAGVTLRDLDPFVHMDQMGEVDYAPGEPRGTSWHPHRGFETVTYMIDGTFQHQDSHGGGGTIENGATQWMTAGAGILHIETPPEQLVMSGGLFHGIQLWVNLPAKDKFAPGAQLSVPWQADFNALVYVLSGNGSAGAERRPIHTGQLALFGPGDRITVSADAGQDANRPALEVLLLGGRPIREPVAHYGPFVMNTTEELQQAIDDFRAGKLGVIPENALMPHTGAV